MAQYRKKPVVVEAVPAADLIRERGRLDGIMEVPQWLLDAIRTDTVQVTPYRVHIQTREGIMRGEPGDMIIRGVKGEIYPCKPDIFAETYELVA